MSVENILKLKNLHALALEKGVEGVDKSTPTANLSIVSEESIHNICNEFGEEALFKMNQLAHTNTRHEFEHFLEIIESQLLLLRLIDIEQPLQLDNAYLRSGPELNNFAHNVINNSLSRKLFNPGRKEGFLVYGIGGPRILVSLPFKGASKFGYDVYRNSIDVVTSLMVRGYLGTFLLLDSMEGLNREYFGQPGWLLWFSIIAAHSDLIVFVKEQGRELSDAQKLEVAFTPDRVGKKLVEFTHGELTWADKDDIDPSTQIKYLIPGRGLVSQEEWEEMTLKTAEPLINIYNRDGFPDDRLIVIDESGNVTSYPLL